MPPLAKPRLVLASLFLGLCFGVFLFVLAFFPSGVHVQGFSKWSDFQPRCEMVKDIPCHEISPQFDRLIIIVIDALRYDLVFGANSSHDMPFVHHLIKSGHAIGWKSEAESPTVTLPRLKAILGGFLPGYIDIVQNLDSPALEADSLIAQMHLNDKKIVFYGDDTWTKMFPGHFLRQESTTAFFVSDYTQVDDNVTRHIDFEVKNDDWDAMILHYLGVDHIGHLYGAKNAIMQQKLHEMDHVIQQVYSSSNNRTIIAVLSDHGMTDQGNHGGGSTQEVESMLMLASPILNAPAPLGKIKQIDICPTLSLLLGLPIPRGNTGRIITRAFSQVGAYLHANAQQLSAILTNKNTELLNEYASILHDDALVDQWLDKASSWLQGQALNHDVFAMFTGLAIVIACSSAFGMWCFCLYAKKPGYKPISAISLASGAVFLGLRANFDHGGILSNYILVIVTLVTITWSVLMISIVARSFTSAVCQLWRERTGFERFMSLLLTLHFLFLFGSSYIEEDHYFWYYFAATCQISLLMSTLHDWYLKKEKVNKWTILRVFLLIILTRFSREWNNSGDKWLRLPDIGKVLENDANMMTIMSLATVIALCIGTVMTERRVLYIIAYCAASIMAVRLPVLVNTDFGAIVNARMVMVIISAIALLQRRKSSLFLSFLILCVLLHRRRDSFLLALFAVQVQLASSLGKSVAKHLSLFSMGMSFYSMLGNTVSLSSVYIAGGFTGLSDYNAPIVAFLTFLLTYSGQILCMFANNSWTVLLIAQRVLEIAMYSITLVLFSSHLFVWSVFAPKFVQLSVEVLALHGLALLIVK